MKNINFFIMILTSFVLGLCCSHNTIAQTNVSFIAPMEGHDTTLPWSDSGVEVNLDVTQMDTVDKMALTNPIGEDINPMNDYALARLTFNECPPFEEVVNIKAFDVTCNGNKDGKIVVEMNGAKPFNICISYGCEPGAKDFNPVKTQTASYKGLTPGNYLITVVDANGCEYTECVTVGEPDAITAEVDFAPIRCNGESTEVTVTGFGGNPPYTLFNEEGEALETFDVGFILEVFAGTYNWTLGDVHGCEAFVIDFAVTEPKALDASYEKEDILCFGNNTGAINAKAEGGTGSLIFSLEMLMEGEYVAIGEPQVNGMFESLFAGEYRLTVTDENRCTALEYVVLDEEDELDIHIDKIIHAKEGENNGSIVANLTGGVGPYYVSLYTNCDTLEVKEEETVAKMQGMTYWSLQPGSYVIMVTDQNGCIVYSECIEIETTIPDVNLVFDKDENALSDGNYMVTEAQVSAYPNPFTTNTTIEFTLTENSDVTLEIYNLVGERVSVFYKGQVNAFESHKHTFNAESLPSGIYIYKLTAGEKIFHNRIILTR